MKHNGNLIIGTKSGAAKYAAVTEVTGDLYISADASLPVLTSVGGGLYIRADASLPALTSVGGVLSISADSSLPVLTSVGGTLGIYADASLPVLTSVGGDIYIRADASLPVLTSVGGVLSISADSSLPVLTSVGGVLSISADSSLPVLSSVGGNLYIRADASLPVLTSVGGVLSISADSSLPVLTSVGGNLYIRADASLPVLASVGDGIYISAKLEASNFYAKGFANFRVYDGIPCAVIRTKAKDGVEILNCRRAQIKDGKIVGDRFIVAKRGNATAHATTIKDALQELAFKNGARDVEQYRNMPLTTRKSPNQWAAIYRQVTGACQFGTRDFMARRTLKKSYTLKEILKETKGAFGHETFRGVVSP